MNLYEAREKAQQIADRTGEITIVTTGQRIGEWDALLLGTSYGLGAEKFYPSAIAHRGYAVTGCGRNAESLACHHRFEDFGD